MEKDDLKQDESLENDEDLLNFDLDDISFDEIDQTTDSESEEEVIELVNLVEKGESPAEESFDLDLEGVLEEDQGLESAPVEESPTADLQETEAGAGMTALESQEAEVDFEDLSLSDLELEETSGSQEPLAEEEISGDDLDQLTETEADEEMISDLPDEGEMKAETPLEEDLYVGVGDLGDSEPELEEAASKLEMQEEGIGEFEPAEQEISEEDFAGFLEEQMPDDMEMPSEGAVALEAEADEIPSVPFGSDIGEQTEGMEAKMAEMELLESAIEEEAETPPAETPEPDMEEETKAGEPEEVVSEAPPEGIIGISEEEIEAIITRVVQDVVERVIRETMTSVAERVIGEAIEALKQSLESSPE